jgi:GNAT superfamily N-acetyltransferase
VNGWGLTGPLDAAIVDAAEAFYRERGMATRVAACPLADGSVLPLLSERGYTVQDFMNVHVRQVAAPSGERPSAPDLDIRVATVEETRAWYLWTGAGGDWAEPDGVAFMTIRCALKAGSQLYLAWRGEQPIGGGGLEIHDGLASLIADDTLSAYRGQGVQSALLKARLQAAAEAGCDLAVMHTRPASGSERNVLRAGFQLAYTRVGMRRPPG